MRLFVYEHICGGGMAGQFLPEKWVREGWAMLAAIVEDFDQLEEIDVIFSLDARLSGRKTGASHSVLIDTEEQYIHVLAEQSRKCDAVFVIAPETDGILLRCCQVVEHAGGRMFAHGSQAVTKVSDKLELNRFLSERGVPVPVSKKWVPGTLFPEKFPVPAVIKPRQGAGSDDIYLVPSNAHNKGNTISGISQRMGEESLETIQSLGVPRMKKGFMLEEYVSGIPVSICFLISDKRKVPLLAGFQHLSRDGRFRYQGGMIPCPQDLQNPVAEMAQRALQLIPGLHGFTGVDLVVCSDRNEFDGRSCSEIKVIEINPRLTTSYVGLRRLANENIARWMVQAFLGQPLNISWKPGVVEFDSGGTVDYRDMVF